MMYRSSVVSSVLFSALLMGSGSAAYAAEGATSHYLPGLPGELDFALPPSPGLTVRNILWSQSGHVDAAILSEEEHRDVEVETTLDIIAATYTFDARLWGGTYSAGVLVPFGSVSVDADRVTAGGLDAADGEDFGLGDIELVPLQLNWSRGNFHFKLSQSLIAPTGSYDKDEIANVGRGHWSFDTVGAVTWYNPDWGTEVSAALGLMHNAHNSETDYHSGNESHFDFAINQRLTDSFALGVTGYRLNQLKSDFGGGADLGPLEGFSRGIGAGFEWTPAAAHGALVVSGKYMNDYEARDGRVDSEHASLTLTWTF